LPLNDLKSGILLFVISAVIAFESLRIGIGEWNVPGPGFVPFWAAVIQACLSILLIIVTLNEKPAVSNKKWYEKVLWQRWGVTLASIIAYTLLLEHLGFIICTLILIITLILTMDRRRWKLALVMGVFASLGSYLVFAVWLKAQLPKGLLGI